MRPKPDYTLYLVASPRMCAGRPVETVVEEAVRGGVTLVQLRIKDCSTREYIAAAEGLHGMLQPLGVPLIINDRVDVALAARAEGVHVGQSDMAAETARRLMGEDAIIGLTIDSRQQARDAENVEVDYLGIGPIFPTATKADTAPEWGVEGLRAVRAESRHTLIAIGGIGPASAGEVIQAGADGIAVVSAVCSAPDPRQAAQGLSRIIRTAREGTNHGP